MLGRGSLGWIQLESQMRGVLGAAGTRGLLKSCPPTLDLWRTIQRRSAALVSAGVILPPWGNDAASLGRCSRWGFVLEGSEGPCAHPALGRRGNRTGRAGIAWRTHPYPSGDASRRKVWPATWSNLTALGGSKARRSPLIGSDAHGARPASSMAPPANGDDSSGGL